MLFVGIDAASEKHDACIIQNGVILSQITFDNDDLGYKKLYTEIQSHTESLNVYIGMEITGIYHDNLASFLHNQGYIVYATNADLVNSYGKSLSPRVTKTDVIDAMKIASFISQRYTGLNPYTPKVYTNDQLKSLSRLRFDKVNLMSKRKVELKRLLMIVFPEFVKYFKYDSQWALTLLSSFESTEKISRMHTSTLVKLLKTKGDRLQKASFLKQIAKSTVGRYSLNMSLEIRMSVADIFHFQNQINEIEDSITPLMDNYKNILSIPGVGLINAALIIGEIGDPFRFNNKFQLLAFAGCDPTVYESGKYRSKRNRLSKRGSKFLRCGIYHAATAVSISPYIQNTKFRQKYLTKIAQGKHYYSALFHVGKNLLFTIFTLLKTGEYYNDSIK